ncbi:phage tail tube protein [Aeromonas enteropelogenes]|uniref:phage tail tube protein n=1 Tax=Aeromonas enteropelogenes TaxID=29489 RepID=UPI003B9F9E55
MNSSKRYQGKAIITVNGREYATLDGATLTTSGETRSVVKGAKVYGFNSEPTEATLEAKFPNNATTSLEEINSWEDVTVNFKPDVGPSHMMANAWVSTTAKLTFKGEISVSFAACESKEI